MSVNSNKPSCEEHCQFCKIVTRQNEATIKYEDDEFIAFDDKAPASDLHLLIIPKKHIKNATELKSEDYPLVNRMREIALQLAEQNNAKNDDIRIGFHWPPFVTINHLHLHLIAPVSKISFQGRFIFRPGSFWFIEVDPFMLRLGKPSLN